MNNQGQSNRTVDSTSNKKPKKPKKKSNTKQYIFLVLQVIIVMGLMGVFIAGGAALGFVASIVKDQQPISYEEMKDIIYTNQLTSFAYFSDGTPIGKLPAVEDRRLVTLSEISPYVEDALLATEDKSFREHKGVSIKAFSRAVWQQISNSDVQTGGSTITQQLVKQTLLEEMWKQEVSGKLNQEELRDLKFTRKFNELFLALRVERYFSKDQILEAYLNEMMFGSSINGSNLYGIQSAAKGIFGVDAIDLNLPQSAYLVGALQRPAVYNPFKEAGLQKGLERMKLVLRHMLDDDKITQAEYDEAVKYDVKANLVKNEDVQSAYDNYPFLLFEIMEQSAKALVENDLRKQGYSTDDIYASENSELYDELLAAKKKDLVTKGYHIYTTIDKELYDAFQEFAADENNFMAPQTYTVQGKTIENALQQIGAVLIENKTGKILANVPGRDFNVEQTNHVYAPRQPGSAMKPVAAYAPAFEEGVLLSPESPIDDAPIVLNYGKEYEHTPMNVDNKFHGIMSARYALSVSYNIPAIKTYLDVGIEKALGYVKKMGINTIEDSDVYSQTGVIGGLARGTTVEEITNSFTTFANNGDFIDAYLVERIADKDGETFYQHQVTSVPVFSEQTAWFINDMLKTAYTEGTGRSAKAMLDNLHGKRVFATKSGTTNSKVDLWFIGYNPNITLGVWTGFDVNYSMPKNSWSREAWVGLMDKVLSLRPELSPADLDFTRPDGLVQMEIDSKSGMLPSELSREAGHVITATFKKEFVPTEIDTMHERARIVIIDGKSYLAQESTPDDMVISKIVLKTEPIQIPTKEDPKKPLSILQPTDWMDRMPEEVDPRMDDGIVPEVTTGITVTHDATRNVNIITWTPNPEPDVVGYRIYRFNGFTYDRIASVPSSEQKQFEDTTGDPLSGYYITAVDVIGQESEPSPIVSTTGISTSATDKPTTPRHLGAFLGLEGLVLSWATNPEDEQVYQYNIYHSATQDGEYSLLTSTPIATYIRPILVGDIGWYRVTAVNLRGESEPTNPVTVKLDNTPSDDVDDSQNLIDIPTDPEGDD